MISSFFFFLFLPFFPNDVQRVVGFIGRGKERQDLFAIRDLETSLSLSLSFPFFFLFFFLFFFKI